MAGYFLSGMAQGLQFGMQYELSKNNMDLLSRQIDLKEQEMSDPEVIRNRQLTNEKLQQEISLNKTKADAYKKQVSGGGGFINPMQKTGIMQGFETVKQNASLALDPVEGKRYIEDLQKYVKAVDSIDIEDGKPSFTESERSKVKDFASNLKYYAYLQKADTLKVNDNNVEMKAYQDMIKNDKSLTVEQSNKLISSFDPTSKVTPTMLMTQSDIEGSMKSWKIDNKTGIPIRMNITDVDNKIQEIQSLYQQDKVSGEFYSSNMSKLKGYAIKMDMNNVGVAKGDSWFNKDYGSVAQVSLTMADSMIPKSKKSDMEAFSQRYDIKKIINDNLVANNINLKSTNPTDIEKAKSISNQVLGEMTVNSYKIFKGEDATNPSTREIIVARANKEEQTKKAEETVSNPSIVGQIFGGFRELGTNPQEGGELDRANKKKATDVEIYGDKKTGWKTTKGNPYREGSVMWKQYEDNIRKGK